jgi:hypothetical protein
VNALTAEACLNQSTHGKPGSEGASSLLAHSWKRLADCRTPRYGCVLCGVLLPVLAMRESKAGK